MNFREKIEKSEPPKFQKNQQDADYRAKAAGRRFELGRNFRRANPIFPKENLRRRMIFGVCLQTKGLTVSASWFFRKDNEIFREKIGIIFLQGA